VKARGERIRDQGLATRGFLEHAYFYALAYAVVLVCVVVVSFDPQFTAYYPFYRQSYRSWLELGIWELLYMAQFFSLEFFFRGFLLKAVGRSMGSHAIFAMVVPYVIIHFGKPLPETFAAIAAGIVLGTLAMRTGSIWSGFLIHVSVALSMDFAALLQTTGLPRDFAPPL
jgi:membrane protease YdiL (CAAX protease family)